MQEEAGSSGEAPPRGDDGDGDVVLQRGPGVHVVADAHPARAGRILASTLGADLADSPAAVELAIRARLTLAPGLTGPDRVLDLRDGSDVIDLRDPGGAHVGGHSRADSDPREAQRLDSSAPAPTRTLAVAHVSRLRQLAAALERAERVHSRTERRVTEGLLGSEQSDASVDSEAVRAPASERFGTSGALTTLASTREAGSQLVAEPGAELQQVPHSQGAAASSSRSHPRNSAPIAGGVLLLGVALAGAILLTGVPPVLAIAPLLFGLFVAGLVRRTTPRPSGGSGTGRPFDTMPRSGLPGVSIDAPTARHAHLHPASADEPRGGVTSEATRQLARRLDEAQQERIALAGAFTDTTEAAEVVRSARASPDVARIAASESAAVRAAALARDRAREAWHEAWADLGVQRPPNVSSGPALDADLARLRRRIEDGAIVLGGSQAAADDVSVRRRLNELLATRPLEVVVEGEPGPMPATAVPLVLVDPFAGLDDAKRAALQRELERLADRYEVIVIVRDGPRRTPSET